MSDTTNTHEQDQATIEQLNLLDTETLWSIQERGAAKWSECALLIIRSRELEAPHCTRCGWLLAEEQDGVCVQCDRKGE
jgi:hypothetical protein